MAKKQGIRKFLVSFDGRLGRKKIHLEEVIESDSRGKAKWIFAKKYKVHYIFIRIKLA